MKKTDTLPATLSALLQEYSIAEGIQMAEQQVRENPAKALCRHSLFQLLCVAGLVAGATPASAMRQDGGQLYPGGPAVPGAGSLRNVPPHRFSG